jgi:exodeoxyribonuclease VII small subunit
MNQNHSSQSQDQKPSFEVALERLQLSVKKLESGELSLEDSLKQFEEGVKLTQICQDYLNVAEQKIEILTKGSSSEQAQFQNFS